MYTRTLLSSLLAFALPLTASAASITLLSIAPGTSVQTASNLSLTIVPSGLSYPVYSLTDSFSNSSASSNNIEPGGRFSWTPSASDVGTHTFTFTATGSEGAVSTTQTITVLPPPTMAIGPLSPGNTVLPGKQLTFAVTTSGFTNPTFTVGDSSGNPSVQPTNIDASGRFSWTPALSDIGDHSITVYVSDSLGHSMSRSVSVHVGNGPTLAVMLLTPGSAVNPGQLVTFTAVPNDFAPTGFSVQDSFKGSSASSNNMTLTGRFSWTPAQSDVGTHLLTITGVVGAFGASASTTQTITVLGPGGTAPAATPAATSTDTLSALQAKLAALQGAIASQPAASAPVSGGSFTSYLKPGSSGDEVLRLQLILQKLGYLSATPNGTYGAATKAAVMAFQKARGLEPLGVVGPGTRAILNSLGTLPAPVSAPLAASSYVFEHFMGVGDDDADVSELQKRLIAEGYLAGEVTGYYGPVTEAAVKKYQKAKGLPQTGYVARDTRAALNVR